MKREKRHKHNHHSMKNSKEKDNDKDRLSDLSDCVLLQILSFLNIRDGVQTCILSKRWKILWKHIPTLRLSSSNFRTSGSSFNVMAILQVTEFISRLFSLRDASTSLHTIDLHLFEIRQLGLFKRIITYIVSHKVQHLDIYLSRNFTMFKPFLFSCDTLMSLKLSVDRSVRTCFPNSLNLPALTSLSLKSFTFCVNDDGRATSEPFSALSKLNSLIIDKCEVLGRQTKLLISSTTLVNLTIIMHSYATKPDFGIELYAPSLCTFSFSGIPGQKLCGNKKNLPAIKHANVHVYLWPPSYSYPKDTTTPFVLLNWLVELANIKSLTVTSSTLEVFTLVPDLSKVKFPSLYNLKSLLVKIDPGSSIPEGIVDFLIQNSPSAKVDIID